MGRFEVTICGKFQMRGNISKGSKRREKALHLSYLIYYLNFVAVPCFLVIKEKVRLQVLFESAYSVFKFGMLVASGKEYLST